MATALQGISGLYITLYNRAADSDGQKFWASVLGETVAQAATTTVTLAQMQTLSTSFINTQSSYFNATYGSLTDTQFIQQLYINLGGNGGDTAGITFWVGLLTGGQTRAQVVGRFVNDFISLDLSTKPAGLSDADYAAAQLRQHTFQNKILVSLNYATNPAAILIPKTTTDDAFGAATRVIQGVTADDTTRDAAIAQISAAVAANNLNLIQGGGGVSGTTFNLTPAADNVVGTAANDLVKGVIDAAVAANTTLNIFDSINLGAGTGDEVDVTTVGGGVALAAGNTPVLSGVEKLMLTPTGGTSNVAMNQGFTPNVTTVGQIGGAPGNGAFFLLANGTQTNNVEMRNMVAGGGQLVLLTTAAGLTGASDTANVLLSNVSDTTGAGLDPSLFLFGAAAGDGFDIVKISSKGAANTLLNLVVGGGGLTLTNLVVTGDQALTVTNPILFLAGGAVNVDASGNTGGTSVDVSGNVGAVTFKGGTGNDKVVVDVAELGFVGGTLDGGDGTDTLGVALAATYDFSANTPANNIVLAALTAAKSFEIFQVVNTGAANTATVDPTKIGTFTSVDFTAVGATTLAAPAGIDVIKNNVDAEKISITKAFVTSLTVTEKVGNHILNLDLNSSPTQGAGTTNFVDNGIDTINLSSNGGFVGANGLAILGTPNTGNVIAFGAVTNDNLTMTIKGNTDLTLIASTGVAVGNTYNASTFTGKLQWFDIFNNNFADVVTGGTNADQFLPGRKDQVTTGSGADKVFLNPGFYAAATANDLSQIKDFTAGVDKIQIFGVPPNAPALRFFDATGLNVDAAADVAAAANAAIAGTLGLVPAAKDVYEFKWQAKLYDFINEDGNAVYTPGVDVIVQVTGLVGTHTAGDFFV